jgi:hypothetical protein
VIGAMSFLYMEVDEDQPYSLRADDPKSRMPGATAVAQQRPIPRPELLTRANSRLSLRVLFASSREPEEWRERLIAKTKLSVNHTFENMPLGEIVKRLMAIYDVSIIVSSDVDLDQIIDNIPTANLNFGQVLEILVSKIEGDDLTWALKNGAIYIADIRELAKGAYITSYDVRDLIYIVEDYVGPEFASGDEGESIVITETEEDNDAINGDDLVELIRNSTGSDEAWESFDIQIRNGVIIVNNTPEMHRNIEGLLGQMRSFRMETDVADLQQTINGLRSSNELLEKQLKDARDNVALKGSLISEQSQGMAKTYENEIKRLHAIIEKLTLALGK